MLSEPRFPLGQESQRSLATTLSWFIARRYLWGGRSRLLVTTTRAALGSTGLGVMAMIVAMALMNGYTESVQERMLESGALIVVPTFFDDQPRSVPRPEDLEDHPQVAAVTYAVFAQGALISERRPQGLDVFLRGVIPGQGRFGGTSDQLEVSLDGVAGIVLGTELMRRLAVEPGDTLRLVVPDLGRDPLRFRYRTVRVSGSFATHFSEFDRRYAVMDRAVVEELSSGSGLFEVAVNSPDQIDQVASDARELLGDNYLIRDWRRSNPGLFTALRLQKWVLFLILGLIVVVSTFNVVSTLVVLVREKTRDIGVLTALGMAAPGLVRVFVICGLLVGAGGVLLGILGGSLLSWLLTESRLLSFDPGVAEIYFIDFVPFRVQLLDLAVVSVFSMAVTWLAAWLPARRAASVEPAVALRYE